MAFRCLSTHRSVCNVVFLSSSTADELWSNFILAGKVKVKLTLCLTKHHATKTYEEVEIQLHELISALDGGEWIASRPGRFTPGT
jgi:hypothetical protein